VAIRDARRDGIAIDADGASGGVERAADPERAGLQDVGIDHRGADVLVAEEFLDGADIVSGLEEVGGEAVSVMPSSA
jgi:hypothetical protein